MRPSILAFLALGLALLGQPTLALDQKPAIPAEFAPLRFLVGEWISKRADGKVMKASYRFTSGDTSLTETLTPEKESAMTTMYNVNGNSLMLTHYCSLNNQPRMKAAEYKDGDKTLTFLFVDATNLKSPNDPHMHKVTFSFQDQNHFIQTWVLSKDRQELPHSFEFTRTQ